MTLVFVKLIFSGLPCIRAPVELARTLKLSKVTLSWRFTEIVPGVPQVR